MGITWFLRETEGNKSSLKEENMEHTEPYGRSR